MDISAAGLLDFVSTNRVWAAPLAFLMAAMDTTAFLSLVLPATPILIGMGALVAADALDFLPVWLGAASGAVTGASLSWWVGHHFGRAVLDHPPLRGKPGLATRGNSVLTRWGAWAVFLSHVFPPLTSIVFLLAGVVRIPFARFTAFNVPGAMLWAWFLPETGELGTYLVRRLWSLFAGT